MTSRLSPDGEMKYLLVCGEGRMKAFKSLGETEIPAMVIDVDDDDAFIMSLAENIARRQFRTIELLAGVQRLRDQGYDKKIIAEKTIGLTSDIFVEFKNNNVCVNHYKWYNPVLFRFNIIRLGNLISFVLIGTFLGLEHWVNNINNNTIKFIVKYFTNIIFGVTEILSIIFLYYYLFII